MDAAHEPVLLAEVIDGLALPSGGIAIDGTAGGGGHSLAIAEQLGSDGFLLALDRDPDAVARVERRLAQSRCRVLVRHGAFADLALHAAAAGIAAGQANGILLDLGVSSPQLDQPERGFSFRDDGPLDARMDTTGPHSAADLVRDLDESELARIFRDYGEERHARRIARRIVEERERQAITRTSQLAELVAGTVGRGRAGRIHPATRVFQALRIAVNQELEQLEAVLPQAVQLLAPGGRLAVIAFHSLEDRVVKHFMRNQSRDCLCPPRIPECRCGHTASLRLVQRKPVRPGEAELARNARSRSSRLRIAERLPAAEAIRA